MKPSTSAYRLLLLFLFLIVPAVAPSAGTLHELSERRQQLTQQLDSLNLLKQDLKREGTTIADIELHQERLRDSLNYLRGRIQSTSESTNPAGSDKPLEFIQMPTSMFDWIIVIVGGVAFLSGLMLVIGISRSFSSRKRRRAVKNPPQTSSHPGDSKPDPAFPSPWSSDATVENETISSLEQRLPRPSVPPRENRPVVPPENKPLLHKNDEDASENQSLLEKQVLAAANDGLDAAAISRKFHISVDHVALLLKMSSSPRK